MTTPSPRFPFAVVNGSVPLADPDDALRGQLVNVLFTSPGERVDLPDFGCGLFDLVFEPNDELLCTAAEFTIALSLNRWLGDQIALQGVQLSSDGSQLVVEIAYIRRNDLVRDGLRVRFNEGAAWTTG
jgi:phage baseplate assembly protein W